MESLCCRYDLKDTSKITLTDLQLISAMGPPGGGRNAVTPRFLRHFNICSINSFSDETMVRIFSNVVTFYLRTNDFPSDCFPIGNQIVTATLEVCHVIYTVPFKSWKGFFMFLKEVFYSHKETVQLNCFLFDNRII